MVFSERADQTEGSTSQLKPGEIVKLDELLYGLLLPSGNDASVAIAEFVGQRLPVPTGCSLGGSRSVGAVRRLDESYGVGIGARRIRPIGIPTV